MVEFRDYQKNIISEAEGILKVNRFVYLAMEVRTGKTLTSLGIANNIDGVNNVLFVTKKKAISSIQNDYDLLAPGYEATIINYESLHKISNKGWDLIVVDEAHGLGAFPKPSKRAKQIKDLIQFNNPYVIFLSGTPTPESYSQMYHQVYGLPKNPFNKFSNFYKFAKELVYVVQRKINGFNVNDYSSGRVDIIKMMKPFTISYTQKQAGFESSIDEEILRVRMKPITYSICRSIKKDLVVEGEDEVILADTGAKLMSKMHQLYSGTVKFESGNSKVIDTSKADFIKFKFEGKKIGVFYKFKEELNALKSVFGGDLCTSLEDFDSGQHNVIALQIVSGREGISLRNADFIVFYNIDFSATSYWQARDRMTTKDRKHNKVFWVFSEGGIEDKIYRAVSNKKDYTLRHFKNDLLYL
jgi:hypothetical protein